MTFARSAAVESSFSSGTEHSGKVEKEKKKSGGGGIALAAVYAAKLGCYFIVQVRSVRGSFCLPIPVPPANQTCISSGIFFKNTCVLGMASCRGCGPEGVQKRG